MADHALKIHEQPFNDLLSGAKTCEVRNNDRGFQVGDTVQLHEIADTFTGRVMVRKITHVQTGYGLPDGLCVLSYAQLPSQGGEAVEEVASIAVDAEGVVQDFTLEPGLDRHPSGYTVTPLMTVAQHQRILAAATHPADQVAEGVVVPVQLLKIIEQSWRIPNGYPKSVSEEVGEIISNGLAELRALLASAEGGSE